MTAGRCHTLLSPVTEESGEEGTNSEVSSPPVCRSPSPITLSEASMTKVSVPSGFSSAVKVYILCGFYKEDYLQMVRLNVVLGGKRDADTSSDPGIVRPNI